MDYSLLYEYQENLGNTVLNGLVFGVVYVTTFLALLLILSIALFTIIDLYKKIFKKEIKFHKKLYNFNFNICALAVFTFIISCIFSLFFYKGELVNKFIKQEYIPYYNEQVKKENNIKTYDSYYENFRLLKNKDNITATIKGETYYIYEVMFDVESNEKEYISYKKRITIDYPDGIGQKVRDEVNEKIESYNIKNDIAVLHLRK